MYKQGYIPMAEEQKYIKTREFDVYDLMHFLFNEFVWSKHFSFVIIDSTESLAVVRFGLRLFVLRSASQLNEILC